MGKRAGLKTQTGDLTGFLEGAALLMTLVLFAGIALVGLFVTCRIEIDWASQNTERVLFQNGNLAVNLIALAAFLCLVPLLMKPEVKKGAIPMALFVVTATVLVGGFLWVEHTYALPGADALSLVELARAAVSGDWSKLAGSSYLRVFPFQMGYLWYLEGLTRLLGGENLLFVQKLNVVFVALANLTVTGIAHELFRDQRITFLTALLTILFIQPVFLTTFIYGNLPGMFFAFLAIYCALRGLRGSRLWFLPAALAIAAAGVLKMNFFIVLIAIAIVLGLTALRQKKTLYLLIAGGLIAASLLIGALPRQSYEARAGVSFGDGTPQGAWLVTGFRESSLCSGWYNSYTTTVLMKNGYDQVQTKAQIRSDFNERLQIFLSRPRYAAAFFGKKLISQWLEPSYQSIWSSAAGTHSAPVPAAVESVYTGKAGETLFSCFTQLVHLIYFGFALGLIALIKQRNLPALILPLVLLGAAIYHLLFEAKAQYVLVYIPLMLPVAALGFRKLSDLVNGETKKRRKRRA